MSEKLGQDDADVDSILIESLARGCSHARAAKESGVSVRTVQRRLEKQDFRDQVKTMRRTLTEQATGRLAASSRRMVDILVKLATSAKSEIVRAKCAMAVLEICRRYDEHFELVEDVRELQEWRKGLEA